MQFVLFMSSFLYHNKWIKHPLFLHLRFGVKDFWAIFLINSSWCRWCGKPWTTLAIQSNSTKKTDLTNNLANRNVTFSQEIVCILKCFSSTSTAKGQNWHNTYGNAGAMLLQSPAPFSFCALPNVLTFTCIMHKWWGRVSAEAGCCLGEVWQSDAFTEAEALNLARERGNESS